MATSKIRRDSMPMTTMSQAFDMNDILESGIYFANVDAPSITNWPHSDGWLVFAVLTCGSGTVQIVFGGRQSTSGKTSTYLRYRLATSSTPWKGWLTFTPSA